MAALTPTSTQVLSLGNRIGVQGTFTAIANADTWAPGLSTVEACYVLNGASGQTTGATYSSGTITFAASGAHANAKVLAIGT